MAALGAYEELAMVALFAATAAVLVLGRAPLIIRLPYGLLAVLLLPGLALSALVFPARRDLLGVERVALSLGLSLALTAIAAPALDRSPWGLTEETTTFTLTALTLALTAIAAWRRSQLPPAERMVMIPQTRWSRLDRPTRAAALMFTGAVTVSGAALAATLASAPAPRTAFYLVGPDGLAEGYPRSTHVGEKVVVKVGIVNREAPSDSFRVAVVDRDNPGQPLGEIASVQLTRHVEWEGSVTFVPRVSGTDRHIIFLLWRGEDTQPIRELGLWLDVLPP